MSEPTEQPTDDTEAPVEATLHPGPHDEGGEGGMATREVRAAASEQE